MLCVVCRAMLHKINAKTKQRKECGYKWMRLPRRLKPTRNDGEMGSNGKDFKDMFSVYRNDKCKYTKGKKRVWAIEYETATSLRSSQ